MSREVMREVEVVRIPAGKKLFHDVTICATVARSELSEYPKVLALARTKSGDEIKLGIPMLERLVKDEDGNVVFFKPDAALHAISAALEDREREQDPQNNFPYSYSILAFSFKKDREMTVRLQTRLVDTAD